MAEYIERGKFKAEINRLSTHYLNEWDTLGVLAAVDRIPAADVRPVPEGGIGEMSDGYHTFNGLYYQRMVLFAALVKAHKGKAWKSRKHEDGKLCFGGGWFIVGIDTPEGSYTYHYEAKDWDMFDCVELPVSKHWDGHTEKDVARLLSLYTRPVVRGEWVDVQRGIWGTNYATCSACSRRFTLRDGESRNFCLHCGSKMDGGGLNDATD